MFSYVKKKYYTIGYIELNLSKVLKDNIKDKNNMKDIIDVFISDVNVVIKSRS